MHLVMAIGKKILERMAVDTNLIKDEEYLEACCKILEKKNWLTVAVYQQHPQFYLEVASAVQASKKRGKDLN